MITFLSVVTSIKDYIEIAHKLIEVQTPTSEPFWLVQNYDDFGALVTYFLVWCKSFLSNVFSLNWLKTLWSLPILVPEISSAMIGEISVIDGLFHNAFNFSTIPVSYGNQDMAVSALEKFFIGFLNSFFLFLPTSTAHIITLRRFVLQGLEAGVTSALGTLAANLLWLCSLIFGWRFFVISWLSLDIFRYVLGFVLIVTYLWHSSKEKRMVVQDLAKIKIFLLNFLLALTEQTSMYAFINNMSLAPQSSVYESFAVNNYSDFILIHGCYILGICIGSLSLLKFTCWFWQNPAFNLYIWFLSSYLKNVNLTTSSYYKILNFFFMYLTMVCAVFSFSYFGLDYIFTNPLGFIPQDRLLEQKQFNQLNTDAQKFFPETSFLSVNATDKNRRTREGVRGRRERWKERLVKYEALDASLYDQGVYSFLTLEDLNYGFDRFWLRRKMRNHKINFRLIPGPFMRSLKKQLNKNNLLPPNESKETSSKDTSLEKTTGFLTAEISSKGEQSKENASAISFLSEAKENKTASNKITEGFFSDVPLAELDGPHQKNSGKAVEFFRLLFEQYYNAMFHSFSPNITPNSTISEANNFKHMHKQNLNVEKTVNTVDGVLKKTADLDGVSLKAVDQKTADLDALTLNPQNLMYCTSFKGNQDKLSNCNNFIRQNRFLNPNDNWIQNQNLTFKANKTYNQQLSVLRKFARNFKTRLTKSVLGNNNVFIPLSADQKKRSNLGSGVFFSNDLSPLKLYPNYVSPLDVDVKLNSGNTFSGLPFFNKQKAISTKISNKLIFNKKYKYVFGSIRPTSNSLLTLQILPKSKEDVVPLDQSKTDKSTNFAEKSNTIHNSLLKKDQVSRKKLSSFFVMPLKKKQTVFFSGKKTVGDFSSKTNKNTEDLDYVNGATCVFLEQKQSDKLCQSHKKTLIREKLSKKQRQILYYKTLLQQNALQTQNPYAMLLFSQQTKQNPIINIDRVSLDGVLKKTADCFKNDGVPADCFKNDGVLKKTADLDGVPLNLDKSKGGRTDMIKSDLDAAVMDSSLINLNLPAAQTIWHPLNFYLHKQQAFGRKLKFYGTGVFRKLSVGVNAPFFKTMMKRFFYYYKPTLRYERTINSASLRADQGFRKKSRLRKKLNFKANVANSKTLINVQRNPENTISLSELQLNKNFSESDGVFSSTEKKQKAIDQKTADLDGVSLEISNSITKPTHSYSVLGKKASRYRYEIYRDVVQHWYYTPFNRLLLKFDVDAFMSRQPKSHYVTKKEEHVLHLRRFLLSQYYDTVRWYTSMSNYGSMKTTIGGTKSFSSGIYNQQFHGTFKKIRHLFAITPSQNLSKGTPSKGTTSVVGSLQTEQSGMPSADLFTNKKQTSQLPALLKKKPLDYVNIQKTMAFGFVLKFDQPLINQFANDSANVLINSSVNHEELQKSQSLFQINPDSNKAVGLQISPFEKQNQTNSGFNIPLDANSPKLSLSPSEYKETSLDLLKPVTNASVFKTNTKPESEMPQFKNFYFNNGLHQKLWIRLLKQNKRRINDSEFIKNYVVHRIEKTEQINQQKQQQLKNRLLRLQNWLIGFNLVSKSEESGTLSLDNFATVFAKLNKQVQKNKIGVKETTGSANFFDFSLNHSIYYAKKKDYLTLTTFLSQPQKRKIWMNTSTAVPKSVNAAESVILTTSQNIKHLYTSILIQKKKALFNNQSKTWSNNNLLLDKNQSISPASYLYKSTETASNIKTISFLSQIRLKIQQILVTGLSPLRALTNQQKTLTWWRKKQQALTKRKKTRKKNRFKKFSQSKRQFNSIFDDGLPADNIKESFLKSFFGKKTFDGFISKKHSTVLFPKNIRRKNVVLFYKTDGKDLSNSFESEVGSKKHLLPLLKNPPQQKTDTAFFFPFEPKAVLLKPTAVTNQKKTTSLDQGVSELGVFFNKTDLIPLIKREKKDSSPGFLAKTKLLLTRHKTKPYLVDHNENNLFLLPKVAWDFSNLGQFKNITQIKKTLKSVVTNKFRKKKSVSSYRRYKVFPSIFGYSGIRKAKILNKEDVTKEDKLNFLLNFPSVLHKKTIGVFGKKKGQWPSEKQPDKMSASHDSVSLDSFISTTKSSWNLQSLLFNKLPHIWFLKNDLTQQGLRPFDFIFKNQPLTKLKKTAIKRRVERKKAVKQKYSEKIYKYAKRKIQAVGKLRNLNKKINRLKSNIVLQKWWWQDFLPAYQASVDMAWQIEKDEQVQNMIANVQKNNIAINSNNAVSLTRVPLNAATRDAIPVNLSHTDSIWSSFLKKNKLSNVLSNTTLPNHQQQELLRLKNMMERKTLQTKTLSLEPLEPLDIKTLQIKMLPLEIKPPLEIKTQINQSLNLPAIQSTFNTESTNQIENMTNKNTFKEQDSILSADLDKLLLPYIKLVNPIPFYAGWDENLRKLVITNNYLSRRQAGTFTNNIGFFSDSVQNKASTLFSKTQSFQHTGLEGLNEASFLYYKTDMPFNAYAMDQFNGISQTFYAPLGWRRFQFRHSILKTWFSNKSHNLLPITVSGLPISFVGENKQKPIILRQKKKSFISIQTIKTKKNINRRTKKRYKIIKERQDSMPTVDFNYMPTGTLLTEVLPSHYLSIFQNQYRFANNRYLKMPFYDADPKAAYKADGSAYDTDLQTSNVGTSPKSDSMFASSELSKANTLTSPLDFFGQQQNSPELPLALSKETPSKSKGTPNSVNPSDLSNSAGTTSALDLNLTLRKATQDYQKAYSVANQQVQNVFDLNFLLNTSTPESNSIEFTLRKRIKTKRNYHRKRSVSKGGLIFPRRRKFLQQTGVFDPSVKKQNGILITKKLDSDLAQNLQKLNAQLFILQTENSHFTLNNFKNESMRWRPSAYTLNKKAAALMLSNSNLKSLDKKKKKRTSFASFAKTNPSRLRQLRRREFQQIIKPPQRFQPSLGGFVWPGNYLMMEFTEFPKLISKQNKSSITANNTKLEQIVMNSLTTSKNFNTNPDILNPNDEVFNSSQKSGSLQLSSNNAEVSNKTSIKAKIPNPLVGIIPRTYLIQKHNIKVLKKKLQKAYRCNQSYQRIKQLTHMVDLSK